MKLTIVVACWRKPGVEKTIIDLKNQTYQNFEVILVNDCSESILREDLINWCKDDPRFHWIDIGFHTGFYGGIARNIGVMTSFVYFSELSRKADTDWWIAFHDDDNYWYPNYLEERVQAHKDHPEAVLVGGDIEVRGVINPDYNHIMACKVYPQNCDLGCWIYRHDMFAKYGFFPASDRFKITYDWELVRRISVGEGMDKIHMIQGPPSFAFYHRER
jgi:glycosyltransferase involved in cell wall biosynthesis